MKTQRSADLLGAYTAEEELAPNIRAPRTVHATFTPEAGDELPYLVEMTITFEGGRYGVELLTCRRTSGGCVVDSAGMRMVPIAKLIALAVTPYVLQSEVDGSAWAPFPGASPEDALHGPTNETLRKLAAVYAVAYACGLHPVKAVTDTFGLARSTAGRWVSMARERGLLGPTTPGKPSG